MAKKVLTKKDREFINSKFGELSEKLDNKNKLNPLPDTWLDIQEVCQLLKISKRTLQSYRDSGKLGYSKISGKIYIKASSIQEHLESHYVKAYKK